MKSQVSDENLSETRRLLFWLQWSPFLSSGLKFRCVGWGRGEGVMFLINVWVIALSLWSYLWTCMLEVTGSFITEGDTVECRTSVSRSNMTPLDNIVASCQGRVRSHIGSPNCFSSSLWATSHSLSLWTWSGAWWHDVLKTLKWRCLEFTDTKH